MKNVVLGILIGFLLSFSLRLAATEADSAPFFAHSPKVAEEHMLREAKALYANAYSRGEFTTTVSFVDGTLIRKAPAWVNRSADKGCEFFLAPRYASRFSDEISFKFLVLHELSHCEAYHRHPLAFSWPSLNVHQNRLLSDLIYLEATMLIEDERQNGYGLFHETYADVRAWALMIRGGVKPADLMAFYGLRGGGFDRRHATYTVLSELSKYDWAGYSLAEFEQKVSFLTGQALMENFVCPTWLGGDACSLDFDWEVYWKSNTTSAFNQWLIFKKQPNEDIQFKHLRMLIVDAEPKFLAPVPIWHYFALGANKNIFNEDNVESYKLSFRAQVYPFGVELEDIRKINETMNDIVKQRKQKIEALR